MAAVNLTDVNKSIPPNHILKNINLSIDKGEFLAVVGPSGCGKSTLLRLIAGLDSLTSGSILINQQCVNKTPPSKRDMAMVFQSYALYPHMSVFDNMIYALKMRKLAKSEIEQRVQETARLLKLEDFLQRKPHELSGGQKQRVAMGRAIVRSPAVFLFDEPLSNLDAKLRTEMRHEIKKLHQQLKTTCIYVTHDQTEAMTMADRIVVLNQGEIEQVGTPQAIYSKPASIFVAGFTGHYPMNFFSAVYDAHAQTVVSDVGLELHCPLSVEHHCKVLLAVRPEHFVLKTAEDKNTIQMTVDYVDNMGADKLIQGREVCAGFPLTIRVSADLPVSNESIYLQAPESRIHLFHQDKAYRIGEA